LQQLSPINFHLNIKLWIFPFTTGLAAEMFRQMEGLYYQSNENADLQKLLELQGKATS
jgi:hypothetical protein